MALNPVVALALVAVLWSIQPPDPRAETATATGTTVPALELGWTQVERQDLWLRIPPGWTKRSKTSDGLLSLELAGPNGHSGVMLWGGDLGQQMTWEQLAKIWLENAGRLSNNLTQRVDNGSLSQVEAGPPGVVIHFQEYIGQLADQTTRSYVGYLVHSANSFVIMGVHHDEDQSAGDLVRQVVGSLRVQKPAEATTARALTVPTKPEAPVAVTEQGPSDDPPVPAPQAEPDGDRPQVLDLRLLGGDGGEATDSFVLSRDLEEFRAQAKGRSLPPGAKVLAGLYLLKATEAEVPGGQTRPVLQQELTYEGANPSLSFSFRRPPDAILPAGAYQVRLSLGDTILGQRDLALRDPSSAELLAKAKRGDVRGQFGLYAYLEMGKLEEVSAHEAVLWLKKAAEQGLAIAEYSLGVCYFEGKHGLDRNPTLAMNWIRRAALQGHADAARQLAKGFREGLGLPKDVSESVNWTRRAAAGGSLEAQYNLALHYLNGFGVEENWSSALEWFRRAAGSGYEPARQALLWLEQGAAYR